MTRPTPALRLNLPGRWHELPLGDDDEIRADVAAFVREHYGRRDDQATLRAQQRDRLGEAARRARDAGATQYHLSVSMPGDLALATAVAEYRPGLALGTAVEPAAVADRLVRVLAPGEEDGHWERLAASGGAVFERGAEGGAGIVVRTERRLESAGSDDAPTAVADYWLTVPGAASVVLVSFTTALADLAPVMVELFDAIVGAADWRTAGRSLRSELAGPETSA